MAKRTSAASESRRIAGEPDCVVEDDYRPAGAGADRCAQCGLRPGRSPAGEDLGPLGEHPLDGSRPDSERRRVHAGCAAAALAGRTTVEPLGPSPHPAGPGVVHVFEARGRVDPPQRTRAHDKLRARCGFETPLEGREVEWSVYAAGHPAACPGCAAPVDPAARAYPARFPRPA